MAGGDHCQPVLLCERLQLGRDAGVCLLQAEQRVAIGVERAARQQPGRAVQRVECRRVVEQEQPDPAGGLQANDSANRKLS